MMDEFLISNKSLIVGNVYDLGCGESPYKDFILNNANNYYGVDWGESVYNSKPDIIADLNKKLPIESNVADCILSISVMEHLSEPQIMLNEAFRILKKDGVILMQVPWQWKVHEAPYDFFRYSPYGLKVMFEKAGFKNIIIKPSSGFFTTWFVKMNYFTRRFLRGPIFVKVLLKLILIPFWYINQILAPVLDKLDRNRELEAQGFYITAHK